MDFLISMFNSNFEMSARLALDLIQALAHNEFFNIDFN